MPLCELEDSEACERGDAPVIAAAMLTFELMHFGNVTGEKSELGTSTQIIINVFGSNRGSRVDDAVERVPNRPGALILVAQFVGLTARSWRH